MFGIFLRDTVYKQASDYLCNRLGIFTFGCGLISKTVYI